MRQCEKCGCSPCDCSARQSVEIFEGEKTWMPMSKKEMAIERIASNMLRCREPFPESLRDATVPEIQAYIRSKAMAVA